MNNENAIIVDFEPKFPLGQLVTTAGVHQKMQENNVFSRFVQASLKRYMQCDWGDTCEEDKRSNDDALKYGERLLAVYTSYDITIWIITEWDRSATTILFPEEY